MNQVTVHSSTAGWRLVIQDDTYPRKIIKVHASEPVNYHGYYELTPSECRLLASALISMAEEVER